MKTLATTVTVAVLLLGAGCSSGTDETAARSTPTTSSTRTSTPTPTPEASDPATPAGQQGGVVCIAVPADTARRIAAGEKKGVGMVAGRAMAVRSTDIKDIYFVAMPFKVSGVSETQLGVWAIRGSIKPSEQGPIMAVDDAAQKVTSWPHPPAGISGSDPDAGGAKACQLV